MTYRSEQKIVHQLPDLLRLRALWRFMQQQVVFTNGCFDLLHAGHVAYLEQARALGNVLVVGVNTDASVARLKPGRPLQDQTSRSHILAALEFVDAVILFAEPTPAQLIEALVPDVLVKGSDYAVDEIVGASFVRAHGGSVQTVALLQGHSTSSLVAKARSLPS